MTHALAPRSTSLALLLVVAFLACSKSTPRIPATDLPPPSVEPIEMSRVPLWVDDPVAHPRYPSEIYLAAVGRSALGISAAEAHAFARLDSTIDLRLDEAWADGYGRHPFFHWEAGFYEWVVESLSPGSGMWEELRPFFGIGREARVMAAGDAYALAVFDRRSAIDYLRARAARSDEFLEEAVDSAMVATGREEWFRATGWSNEAVRHEAERAASTMMRAAIGDTLMPGSFAAHERVYALSDSLQRLIADHGWSVDVSFRWDEHRRPPSLVEPRLKQQLLRLLVDFGFRVGMGRGCPSPIPVEPEPGEPIPDEPEFEDPPPHHVLWITAFGTVGRTPVATWESRIGFDVRAKTCDVGEMVTLQTMGQIVGEEARDADAAYLKALNVEELDRVLRTGFRRINVLPPIELLPEPVTP